MALATEPRMSEQEQKATSIRIELKAVEVARVAAAYKGLSMAEYITGVVLEAANRDIEEGYRARGQAKPVKTKKGGI